MRTVAIFLLICGAFLHTVVAAPLPCVGPGDVDANSVVDATDWALMAPCFSGADVATPPAGCTLETFEYADVDRDGDVDLSDAAAFQNVYSDDYFDYGSYLEDKEAERVALTFAQGLRAPLDLYERARRDLQTIRAAFPVYEDVVYNGPPSPTQLSVRPIDGLWTGALQALVRYYQAEVQCHRGYCTLTFCDQVNMELMATIWEEQPDVESVEKLGYFDLPYCPKCGVWVEKPYDTLIYDFWCCGSGCWCTLSFEMFESGEILSITASHPYGCESFCP